MSPIMNKSNRTNKQQLSSELTYLSICDDKMLITLLIRSVIKTLTDITTGTTSGQTDTTSGQTSNTSGQTSTTNGQMNVQTSTTSRQTSTTNG